nr:neurogenic locus Notch protein-like [Parasteatoda tepidariorum]
MLFEPSEDNASFITRSVVLLEVSIPARDINGFIGSPFFPGKKLSKPHAEITEGTAEGTERIVEAKTAVPIEKEIRFYEAVDKIDPIVLKVLMDEADRWCSCPLNFTGRFCDVDVDECLEPEICDEHQVCINTYGSYRCDCRQGYVWDDYRCVGKTNCYKESCPNFGECVEKDDGRITCICPLGYTGEKCERKLLDCDDSSCTEEEICVATLNGYQCIKV